MTHAGTARRTTAAAGTPTGPAAAARSASRPPMTARLGSRRVLMIGALIMVAAVGWALHHVLAVLAYAGGAGGTRFTVVYALMFALLTWTMLLSYLEPVVTVSPRKQRQLDALKVCAIVPAYNEDPAALWACLRSLIDQERPPQTIFVVDDGSTAPASVAEYPIVRARFEDAASDAGISTCWIRQNNAGKRHAQALAVRATPRADVYWTLDSDGISDPLALDELLKPLSDPRVQSVAGIVLAANVHQSLLCRFTDLWFVAGQLNDRSALSTLGSVWVNSGPIAVYRAEVIRDNLDSYLSETFFGRRVPFSDDSMLTLFAMLRGRTVQQPTAFCYSLMPAKVSHHLRQFVRWMRGSFIRSWWRMRYLPVRSYAYWAHLARWVQVPIAAYVFVLVLVSTPIASAGPELWPWLAGVPLAIGYAQTLRYMAVVRSDQSAAYQWGTWLLTPLAVLWAMTVLRAVRWYGIATCMRTGWGTRQGVEVTL